MSVNWKMVKKVWTTVAIMVGFVLVLATPKVLNIDTMSSSMAGFVWEILTTIDNMEAEKKEEYIDYLNKEISKKTSEYKILFFDFKKTLYRDRRKILENNQCPNCENEMSLVISEKTPCPKCGASLKEEF